MNDEPVRMVKSITVTLAAPLTRDEAGAFMVELLRLTQVSAVQTHEVHYRPCQQCGRPVEVSGHGRGLPCRQWCSNVCRALHRGRNGSTNGKAVPS